ncbi:hypothetical protein GH741_03840 [Aquibacillus halophilus]|uniref:Uncharacterized protein n=1 Tax=Aquibacillus halophilus TaxID=930132 RepID=A0A6A8DKN1_9BACI|nr:hypothetical protein [Aquibacillus halophilus]MRH41802.1 hypothetical protein [Aquibacillus halophilus]
MDKTLRELKMVYEKEIPTSFTTEDKKEVFRKIVKEEASSKKIGFTFIPKAISFIVYAALIFVILGVANQQLNIIEFNNGDNGGSPISYTEQNEFDSTISEPGKEEEVEIVESELKTETIDTSIVPSAELQSIYETYSNNPSDVILQGLTPLDVFKIYFHALHLEDVDTKYATYIQGENYGTPSSEEYFGDPEFFGAIPNEHDKALYSQLESIETFEVNYLVENEATISWKELKDQELAFRLIKDLDADVWKVAWNPMQ